ncbi:MAG: nitrogen fixation protein FixH [Hydrogenophaga sp.]|uniref:nitrogen fixation protein FixH n=1 Tax=Hydrogenophaga sp. TaxID=1904254 RepID=UPI001D69D353|nr:nitrogen fixation protein FixH [Hydrogenophaga sp.]MBX3610277.1 nitrogen fixation protein FixH [Hydrogenophaga sp.]
MSEPNLNALVPEPWWRVGPMWLVVGGPLTVVVAGIATAVIAVKGADPVLDKRAYEATTERARQLQGHERDAALITLQPAGQARNHAASPVLPKEP